MEKYTIIICLQTNDKLDILLTMHHGKLMNEHQLDTLFLVCLLRGNASTYFGRYSPIFSRFCSVAIWCNWVRRLCVEYVQVAVYQVGVDSLITYMVSFAAALI
jgi:hypothetical protein